MLKFNCLEWIPIWWHTSFWFVYRIFADCASWLSGRGSVPNVLAMSNVFTTIHNFPAVPADFRFPASRRRRQNKWKFITSPPAASWPAGQPEKPGKSIECNCMANDPYSPRPGPSNRSPNPKNPTQTKLEARQRIRPVHGPRSAAAVEGRRTQSARCWA